MYNKSEIMKNAWTIRRSTGCNMSNALKKSWADAKAANAKKGRKNMTVIIADRYMTVDQLKARDGITCVKCYGAYDRKDVLKSMGFHFNRMEKSWEKVIVPHHFADLCAEIVISCKFSAAELDTLLESMAIFQQREKSKAYNNDFTTEEIGERYNAYCDSIGY